MVATHGDRKQAEGNEHVERLGEEKSERAGTGEEKGERGKMLVFAILFLPGSICFLGLSKEVNIYN